MQAVTLLAAPLFLRRKLSLDVVAVVYLVADILIVSSIFYFQVFPATYIPETGLTPFKIISEYIISFILIAAIVLLYRNRDSFDRDVLDNLVVAILLTILAELSFTEYSEFTDISSASSVMSSGSFRFISSTGRSPVGQEKPYALLYRNLNESEKKYRALSDLSPDAVVVLQGLGRDVCKRGRAAFIRCQSDRGYSLGYLFRNLSIPVTGGSIEHPDH